jgi:hypothetical protein
MNKSLIVIGVALALGACASKPPKVDTVREEELSTDFVAEGIKVTSSGCGSFSQMVGRKCKILAIESTSTAPSNGGTTNNRKNAMDAACSYALANVRHWMGQRVESRRVVERTGTSNEVSGSKESQNSNREIGSGASSDRSNSNDTTVVVTNTVRTTAGGFMEGWQPGKQEIIGAQEVSCTVVWSKRNTDLMKQARAIN